MTELLGSGRERGAWPFLAAGVALVATKLWLVAALPLVVFAPNYVDDSGFVQLGLNLARGEGLGRYFHYTLIKGPGPTRGAPSHERRRDRARRGRPGRHRHATRRALDVVAYDQPGVHLIPRARHHPTLARAGGLARPCVVV